MELQLQDNKLIIFLDGKIDYTFANHFEDITTQSKQLSFSLLELNFQKTSFITLPGVMYLVFTINRIVDIKRIAGAYFETSICDYSNYQLTLLCNFGFINIMGIYGKLKVSREIIEFAESRPKYWKNILQNSKINLTQIHWPISIIPTKVGTHFQNEIIKFHNDFIDFFKGIINAGLISNLDYQKEEFIEKHFTKAINEATKNVWDHSESWGMASIESNRSSNTTLCLFDFGVGFIKSYIKRIGDYKRTVENDKEILLWLFKEGNTSQSGVNHGHGLSIIQKFTDITQGKLLISTDKYLINYNKRNGLRITEKKYYPGTQIMINF
jgi:hypothetical protein